MVPWTRRSSSRDLAIVLVERRTQDDSHVVLVERVGDTRDDEGEVAGSSPRDRPVRSSRYVRLRGRGRSGSRCSRACDHILDR